MAISAQKNSRYLALAAKESLPLSALKTGTISSAGNIITGVGTAFKSEVRPGDWIVDLVTNDELRKVISITDDTHLIVDEEFTLVLPALSVIRTVRSRAKMISVTNVGGANATLDGVNIIPGQTTTFPKSEKNPNGSDFIDPIIVDPAATTITYIIQK